VRGNDALAGRNAEAAVQAEAGGEGRGLHGENSSGTQGAGRPAEQGVSKSGSSLAGIRQSAEQSWGKAGELYQQKLKGNPSYGRNIVERLRKGAPKALGDVEHAALQDQVSSGR